MKKILLSLFFIFPALMFADVELDVGAYGGYNFRSSSFVESSNNFDCGLTGSFRYFFSRESIFGFGLTLDLGYAFTDNYDFSYKVPSAAKIANPITADSFNLFNHVFNKYMINEINDISIEIINV